MHTLTDNGGWQWPVPDLDTVWFVAFWLLLAAFAFVESMYPAFKGEPNRDDRWPTNLGLGFINMVVSPLIPVSEVVAAEWARANGIGLFNMLHTNWYIVLAATILLRSFATYIFHVLSHKVPLIWRFHRVHHSDTHLDVSTTIRAHPAEFVFLFLMMVPVAVLFGLDPYVLAAVQIFQLTVELFNHSNIRLPEQTDRVLRWLIVTPNMHSLHHSAYQPETDSNYGGAISIWDRMFGTYSAKPRNGYEGLKIGLNEIEPANAANFLWQLKSPAIKFGSRRDRR